MISEISDDPLALDADDVRAVRRPLLEASTLPQRFYVEPRIFALEMERIFGRLWLAAGREEDLPEAGSFLVRQVGAESVLLARGDDGEARAFYNVCRHRGTRLVEERCGRRQRFRCPYHAWSYSPAGELVHAPLMDDRADFDRGDHPLVPIRLESWQGFLFLCFDDEASPLRERHHDLPDVGRYGLGELRRVERHEYEVAANWKILSENYGECYHCALVHPQLHRISHYLSGGDQEGGESYVGGPMTLNPGFDTMTHSGHSSRPSLPGLRDEDRDRVLYYDVYPNLLLSLHRDYVMTHTLWPLAADRTFIVCEWLFHPDTVALPDFDPSDAVDFWDETNRQDWAVCEKTQLGVGSRGYRPGRFHGGESCVHGFDNWYLDRMAEGEAG